MMMRKLLTTSARASAVRGGTPALVRPEGGGRRSPAALVLLALLALAALPALAAAPAAGDRVQVTGVVTDPQGRPLPDLRVVLEASRRAFSLREMRRADRDTRRVAATTNARGEYTLQWPYDPYFNNFELVVGLPLRKGAGAESERIEELAREDVTQRLAKGGPVVSALVVQRPGRIQAVRGFLAGLDSDDERRVFGEMGNPDQVKAVRYPDHEEVSWWYFESGRMYRFRDGALEQVVHFDPVKSF